MLQYCLEGLGGRQFTTFELSTQATRKRVKAILFEDKEDSEIDAGFGHTLKFGPRSACEMQQLRWQTKAIRNTNSPMFGWPICLVEKALRNLSSDGALARKEFHWPIPLTLKYYQPWVLEALEEIWDVQKSIGPKRVDQAFLDVGLYESMCWARWGATKWVQNEPRAAADNTYDPDVPLPPSLLGILCGTTHLHHCWE